MYLARLAAICAVIALSTAADAARFDLSVATQLDDRLGGLTTGTFQIFGSFSDASFDEAGISAAGLQSISFDLSADAGTLITSVTSELPAGTSILGPSGFFNTTIGPANNPTVSFFAEQSVDTTVFFNNTLSAAEREHSIVELVGILDNDPLTTDAILLEQTRGLSFDNPVLIASGTFDLVSLAVTSRLDAIPTPGSRTLLGADSGSGFANWDGLTSTTEDGLLDTNTLAVVGAFSGIIPEPSSVIVWSLLTMVGVVKFGRYDADAI